MLMIFCYTSHIACAQDFVDMQLDVLAIVQWSENNHFTLNSAKCKAMVISRKKNPYILSHSTLNGVVPMTRYIESFKYLGVNISHDLTWSNHIGKICGEARQTLGHSLQTILW